MSFRRSRTREVKRASLRAETRRVRRCARGLARDPKPRVDRRRETSEKKFVGAFSLEASKLRNDEGRAMGQSTRAKSSVLAGSFAHIHVGLGQATLSRELSKALHNGADIRSIQHYDPANDGEFIEES